MTVFNGTPGNDTLPAGQDFSGNNTISGLDGNDLINAGAGNDVVDGGAGVDTLDGGTGNDTLIGGAGNDTLDGGDENDTVSYAGASSVSVSLATGEAKHDGFTDQLSNFENVRGSSGHDTIIGSDDDNVLTGGAGNDSIVGGSGNDTAVFSGNWSDYRITKVGETTYHVTDTRGINGTDTVSSIERFAFDDRTVTESTIVNVVPSLTVGSGAAISVREAILEGDRLKNSIAIADLTITDSNQGDTHVIEITDASGNPIADSNFFVGQNPETSTWKLHLSLNHTLDFETQSSVTVHLTVRDSNGGSSTKAQTITITDYEGSFSSKQSVVGSSEEDNITGTLGNDNLRGGAGNDSITGDAGNDTIYGDKGDRVIGAGADTIIGGDGNDVIVGGQGNDSLDGGLGIDMLSYEEESRNVTITYNASNTGVTLAASVMGGEVDTIAGFEVFAGGDGDDTFRHIKTLTSDAALPSVRYIGGNGSDTLDLSQLFIGLTGAGIEGGKLSINLSDTAQQQILKTTGANVRTESVRVSFIENLIATSWNDDIRGSSEANRIDAGDGDDTIRGAGGADTLIGGLGNDVYEVSSASARVIELANAGIDSVNVMTAGTSYRLGANIENLKIGKNGEAVGNELANVIDGDSGAETLEGGGGADTIDGGSGNDFATYRGSSSGVVVRLRDGVVALAQGGDAQGDVLSNIEHLEGSAFADILSGNSADNILVGGGGNDVLDGGAGNDWADYRSATVGVEIDLRRDMQIGGDAQGDLLISIEAVRGTMFSDKLVGNATANLFAGGLGGDDFDGQGGSDAVSFLGSTAVNVSLRDGVVGRSGDAEGDTFTSIEKIIGSDSNDTLEGGTASGVDYTLEGGNGSDFVSFANATVVGAVVDLSLKAAQFTNNGRLVLDSIENVLGSGLADRISGTSQENSLSGGGGNDTLFGGLAKDTLTGGEGNDVLTGDTTVSGAGGAFQDTFIFVRGGGNDTITDFNGGTNFDVLDFSALGFQAGDLKLGANNLGLQTFGSSDKIALMQRASATADWQIMYRDGEGTSTLTIKHIQGLTWDAKYFDFTP